MCLLTEVDNCMAHPWGLRRTHAAAVRVWAQLAWCCCHRLVRYKPCNALLGIRQTECVPSCKGLTTEPYPGLPERLAWVARGPELHSTMCTSSVDLPRETQFYRQHVTLFKPLSLHAVKAMATGGAGMRRARTAFLAIRAPPKPCNGKLEALPGFLRFQRCVRNLDCRSLCLSR